MTTKVALAARLGAGECGADYPEAIIILSSALSAIAADVWPGNGIDRKRFVEAMKDYCDPTLNPVRISVPMLVGHLRRSGQLARADALRSRFLNFFPSQVLTGDDVDHSDSEIISAFPDLTLKEVREFSYANTLYREVRSALVHEYQLRGTADLWTMAEDADTKISYGNWIGEPDKHIHIPIGWFSLAALSVAKAADAEPVVPKPRPSAWWVDGS